MAISDNIVTQAQAALRRMMGEKISADTPFNTGNPRWKDQNDEIVAKTDLQGASHKAYAKMIADKEAAAKAAEQAKVDAAAAAQQQAAQAAQSSQSSQTGQPATYAPKPLPNDLLVWNSDRQFNATTGAQMAQKSVNTMKDLGYNTSDILGITNRFVKAIPVPGQQDLLANQFAQILRLQMGLNIPVKTYTGTDYAQLAAMY